MPGRVAPLIYYEKRPSGANSRQEILGGAVPLIADHNLSYACIPTNRAWGGPCHHQGLEWLNLLADVLVLETEFPTWTFLFVK